MGGKSPNEAFNVPPFRDLEPEVAGAQKSAPPHPQTYALESGFPESADQPFLTPWDELIERHNDYTELESRFRHGAVPFIDLKGPYAAADVRRPLDVVTATNDVAKYRRARMSTFHTFLEHLCLSSSLVVPVEAVTGRKAELLECVGSILQQTVLRRHPRKVQILIIQDGVMDDLSAEPISRDLIDRIRKAPPKIRERFFLYKVGKPSGRSSARNVGLHYARGEIVFFIDSSMVLHKDFLAEHLIRHERFRDIALIGFKENINIQGEYATRKEDILNHRWLPDYRRDLKWSHKIAEDELPVEFDRHQYSVGEEIRYMEITNFLKWHERWGISNERKPFWGTDSVGKRLLPQFFHTGVTSVRLRDAKEIGGFDRDFNPIWGFEDSFLGALLFARGIKLVPCPSAIAFKTEYTQQEESADYKLQKLEDIKLQRNKFYKKLERFRMSEFNLSKLKADFKVTKPDIEKINC